MMLPESPLFFQCQNHFSFIQESKISTWDGEMEHENSVTVFAEEGCTKTHSQSFAEQCLICLGGSALEISHLCLLCGVCFPGNLTVKLIGQLLFQQQDHYIQHLHSTNGQADTLSYPTLHNELVKEPMLDTQSLSFPGHQ